MLQGLENIITTTLRLVNKLTWRRSRYPIEKRNFRKRRDDLEDVNRWCSVVLEPLYLSHCFRHAFCEGINLSFNIYEEGVRLPLTDDLDGMFQDIGQVKGHSPYWSKGVGTNFVWVETKITETDFLGCQVEGDGHVSAWNERRWRIRCGDVWPDRLS